MRSLLRFALPRSLFALPLSASLALTAALAAQTIMLHPTVTAVTPSAAKPPAATATPASLEHIVPGRLVVVYRSGFVPANAGDLAHRAGATLVAPLPLFGMAGIQVSGDESAVIAFLLAQPEVSTVLHDRLVTADLLQVLKTQNLSAGNTADNTLAESDAISLAPAKPLLPRITGAPIVQPVVNTEVDSFYESPQGWATVLSGGYGNLPGLPSGSTGPWNTTQGSGVRIAILDSGVDATHPDIAPNLVLNLSEVDQTALPSACDDGSPQDQMGHGTFTASLAAAALGGGEVVGVAPQASLLNIKIVERLPAAASSTLTTAAAQCEAGDGSGLLSWVLQGIQDAVANKASVISLSVAAVIDTTTGDGAGWVAQMDSVTYAAAQAGAVIVASAGNNGLNLTGSNYAVLPAQARNVLPVVASTNPACAENLQDGATCNPGPVTRAYYSNFGTGLNALAAPGGSVPQNIPQTGLGVTGFVRGACSNGLPNTTDGLPAAGSTLPGNASTATAQSFGCFNLGHTPYILAIGTSASAPLVAGAAALLRAAHPAWTPAQVVSALLSTASRTGDMAEPELNLPAALALQ